MRTIVILLFIISLFINCINADDINKVIGDYELITGQPPLLLHNQFLGTFEVIDMPGPLDTARVKFTLNIVEDDLPNGKYDWDIRLHYADHGVRIVGDSIFHWPGPHKKGMELSGTIEFVTLRSGFWGIGLYINKIGNNIYGVHPDLMIDGIAFKWCLDDDGVLHYLGKGSELYRDCNTTGVLYYNRSDNRIGWPIKKDKIDGRAFDYGVEISPIPKIGDTSTIIYSLRANRDLGSGYTLEFDGRGVELIDAPDKTIENVIKDEIIQYSIKFIFKGINEINYVVFRVIDHGVEIDKGNYQNITCGFLFSNEGDLRYFTDRTLVPFDKLPTSFKKPSEDDYKYIKIE